MPKINILFPFKTGPWGGANQFLRALRQELIVTNHYSSTPDQANIILVNLNPGNLLPLLKQVSQIKNKQPDKIILSRLDGPISLIRDRDQKLDCLLFKFVHLFADGIIYQSHWSKEENNKIVQNTTPYQTIIHNAADPMIFYDMGRLGGALRESQGICKIIATSWSPHPRKGFKIYKYLDENLDFSRYAMTFVGNSPVNFKNIKLIKPVPSPQLANLLRQHDIYLTASQNDPCSNSLIEAISCGLPAVALNSGGHPELTQSGGELFNEEYDVIEKINLVATNLPTYRNKLPYFSLSEAAQQYLTLAQNIMDAVSHKAYQPKQINLRTKISTLRLRVLSHF